MAARRPTRPRSSGDDRRRAGRSARLVPAFLALLRHRAGDACGRRCPRRDQQGRAALARPRPHPAPAFGADEGGADHGARALFSWRLSRGHAPAAGAPAGRGHDPRSRRPGAGPARSRHGGDPHGHRYRAPVHGRRALVEVRRRRRDGSGGAAGGVGQSSRLSAPADLHLPRPRGRPLGLRLPHHPVQDRARLGRVLGSRLPTRHPGPAQLPAREAHRLRVHHAGRGAGLRRGHDRVVAVSGPHAPGHGRRDPRAQPVCPAAGGGRGHQSVHLRRDQRLDGHRADPSGRRPAPAHLLRRHGDAHSRVQPRPAPFGRG